MVGTRIWIGILLSVVVADFTFAQEIKDAQKAIVAEAADHASLRLQKPRCAALFGPDAEEALRSVEYRLVPMGAPKGSSDGSFRVVAALTLKESRVILINSSGPFMHPTMSRTRIGGLGVDFRFGLQPLDYRALVLLHELGHLTGKFKPDASNSELSTTYTRLVRDHCF